MEHSPFKMLIITQDSKEIPRFYGTRSFIIVLTRARHWSLHWTRCIQSTISHLFTHDPF